MPAWPSGHGLALVAAWPSGARTRPVPRGRAGTAGHHPVAVDLDQIIESATCSCNARDDNPTNRPGPDGPLFYQPFSTCRAITIRWTWLVPS